jgi:hypothetical protein
LSGSFEFSRGHKEPKRRLSGESRSPVTPHSPGFPSSREWRKSILTGFFMLIANCFLKLLFERASTMMSPTLGYSQWKLKRK